MKRKFNLLLIAVSSVLSANIWASEFDEPAGAAINILSALQDSSAVIYINAENLVSGNSTPPTLSHVKTQVLVENKRYLIDFSNIEHETEKHCSSQTPQKLGIIDSRRYGNH